MLNVTYGPVNALSLAQIYVDNCTIFIGISDFLRLEAPPAVLRRAAQHNRPVQYGNSGSAAIPAFSGHEKSCKLNLCLTKMVSIQMFTSEKSLTFYF